MQLELTAWSPDPKGHQSLPFHAGLGWLAATRWIMTIRWIVLSSIWTTGTCLLGPFGILETNLSDKELLVRLFLLKFIIVKVCNLTFKWYDFVKTGRSVVWYSKYHNHLIRSLENYDMMSTVFSNMSFQNKRLKAHMSFWVRKNISSTEMSASGALVVQGKSHASYMGRPVNVFCPTKVW